MAEVVRPTCCGAAMEPHKGPVWWHTRKYRRGLPSRVCVLARFRCRSCLKGRIVALYHHPPEKA